LGRVAEARDLLIGCRSVFEQAGDLDGLSKALSALADVENELQHWDRAVDLEREALRFKYTAADPEAVGVSHDNLGSYLEKGQADLEVVGAHRIAACVIAFKIGSAGYLRSWLAALGRLLAAEPDQVPRSFLQVCQLVGQVPGVDLAELFARLPGDADTNGAVQAVLAAAPDAAAAELAGRVEQAVAAWEPVVSALHTAITDPDPDTRATAATALTAVLDRYADTDDWRALVAVLRRLHAGERDPGTLLDGLNDIDTTITRRVLDVLTGTSAVGPAAWHTLVPDNDNVDLTTDE
jgi:hypothetical protein